MSRPPHPLTIQVGAFILCLSSCSRDPSQATSSAVATASAAPSSTGSAAVIDARPRTSRPSVSLVALIARPEDYRGVDITVSGYFSPDGEPPVGNLFLDRDSKRYNILPNSVRVSLAPCKAVENPKQELDPATRSELSNLREGYMLVQGRFEIYGYPFQAGTLCAVHRMLPLHEHEHEHEPPAGAKDAGR